MYIHLNMHGIAHEVPADPRKTPAILRDFCAGVGNSPLNGLKTGSF